MLKLLLGCVLAFVCRTTPDLESGARDFDPRADSIERWRAHYERVERELLRYEPCGLSSAQRAARAGSIDALRAYRERGDFARQRVDRRALVPQFVDAEGRRCAVAELLHASGRDDLVERVRAAANDAWITDLGGDRAFLGWLQESGLELAEAARIQTPAFEGPGDYIAPGGDRAGGVGAPPSAASGPRRALPPVPIIAAPAPAAPAARRPAETLDAWWMWWEFNKLSYLEVQGLEERLALEKGWSPAEIAAMTDPLRRARETLFLEELRSADALVRASAALAFGRIARERAVPALVHQLEDPSLRVREHALFGLGASGTSEAARVLLALLEGGGSFAGGGEPVSPRAVPLAILALAVGRRSGMEPAIALDVARLAPRASEPIRDRALWAACVFQRLASSSATEALARRLLADATQPRFVRAAAIEALGESDDPKTLAALQHALVGRDLELRRSAALALGRSPQVLALPALMTAYELESEPLARGFALLSIGAQGGPRARDFLLEAFTDGPRAIEPWAALALGIHARGSDDVLVKRKLLEAAPRVRNEDSRPAVLLALGLAREGAAIPLALATLERAPSARERGYAATTLALLGAANRAPLRGRLAAERSGFVRATIAHALATLGDPLDAPALFDALSGLADPGLKAVTAAALGLLGAPTALAALDELARREGGSNLVRATALDGLGLLLERGEPLVLPEASEGANYALYEDWVFDLFQLVL